MGKVNEKVLFWASFFTLIAAGMGFSIRGDILNDWGRQFGFTQTDLGVITGQGLAGFGIAIIFFSFFADLVGYGKLMVVAFLLHVFSVVLTLAAPFAYQQYGKEGAFYCLYLGAWSFSLANGTCEAVINPLTASLFPKSKTHWLNILHAGWPGGLVLGAVVSLLLNQMTRSVPWINWQLRWGIVFAPMLLYGLLMLGRRFPAAVATESGISAKAMMGEVGLLGGPPRGLMGVGLGGQGRRRHRKRPSGRGHLVGVDERRVRNHVVIDGIEGRDEPAFPAALEPLAAADAHINVPLEQLPASRAAAEPARLGGFLGEGAPDPAHRRVIAARDLERAMRDRARAALGRAGRPRSPCREWIQALPKLPA